MKRAAIYARVSTDEQRSNYSIPTQISSCIEYAEQKGYGIVGDQYVDPEKGLDQTTPEGNIRAYVDDFSSLELIRPSLDAAYQYLVTKGYDILIVHALDRLARDPYHRRTLEIKFENVGVFIEYVLGDYDDSAEGEVRKDMDATFAKWENAKRVERSMRGMRAKAKSGLFVAGRAPFGYSIDPKSFGGLAVNEEQAEVVRRIFELYTHDGLSIRGVAEQLEIEELENHSGNVSWGKTTISKTLSNSTYVGRCYYNKWKTQRRTKKLELRDKDEWIEIPTTPIVDETLFRAAQERLAHNRRVRRRKTDRFYLLGGMVYCDLCKRPFSSATHKAGKRRRKNDAPYYRHRVKEGHCKNRQQSARKLDPVVWLNIKQLLLDPESLQSGYKKARDQQKAGLVHKQTQLDLKRKDLEKKEEMKSKLLLSYIDPDMGVSKEEFIMDRALVEKDIDELTADIEELENQLESVIVPRGFESLASFAAEISSLFEGDRDIDPEYQRDLFDFLHLRVFLGEEDTVRIEGWFDPISTRLSDTMRFSRVRPVLVKR